MIKIRRASAIAVGAFAVLAIGGTAALAAGADGPSAPSSGNRVSVPMAPDGDPLATPSADDSSHSPARPELTTGIDPATSIRARVPGNRVGSDDPAGHDAGDDHGGARAGSDDPAGHDAGDDHGGHRGGDDHGNGGHGSDD